MEKSLRQQVLELEIGGEVRIPADAYKYTTIRSYASELSWTMDRTYKSRRNKDDRSLTITRTR